ncbi:hypothetical protein TTRE_0000822701 [Trichuris trichiura]|uniref:Integrase catalytic domain-containing protein n=1 Tax=Trichuris trichiura TaxID=36087 RepID=A0A077ZJP0_TRITR|nr:hypothetical protein TTRE_0000822701 [Trichuris trichiura]
MKPAGLGPNHLFYTGPDFLLRHQSLWPSLPEVVQPLNLFDDPEIYATDWIGSINEDVDPIEALLCKFSRLTRVIRIMAYLNRFCSNARRRQKSLEYHAELDVTEIDNAFVILVRKAQNQAYSKEVTALRRQRELSADSSLIKLTPFLDARQILCVGGRLENAPIPLDSRHPVILPRMHRLTELIIWDTHNHLAHSSADRTLHEIRKLYWIPKGRTTVRRILNPCLKCKRLYAFPKTPRMAALPKFRLTPGLPAFTHCGVDYFGPFEVNSFRRMVKRWACLFTCLATRAVHLEVAYTLDTDSFLSVLFRFEQRRGTPAAYWSDNGTNIVGAKREIQECIQRLDHAKIAETLSIRRISWHFNPPAAPHMALIRSAKRALTATFYKGTLTDEILTTALCYVENLLNGRPLAYASLETREVEVLTFHHLLTGRSQPNFPPDVFTDSDFTFRKRWRYAQALATYFWRRWMEYVPSLIGRGKWTKNERNMSVSDIVVLADPNTPRGS